jgi:hypothetical protein
MEAFMQPFRPALALLCLLSGCAGNSGLSPDTGLPPESEPVAQSEAPRPDGPKGLLDIDISNVLGAQLPARIDLVPLAGEGGDPAIVLEAPKGILEAQVPVGDYRAYVHVYEEEVPVLAETRDVQVTEGATAFLPVNLLEGASGNLPIRAFDLDGDLAIDRVEMALGTNREDPGSVPGKAMLTWDTTVLGSEGRWYRGDLHAHSNHGGGKESVAQLVARAEKMGLDFLAITDRNTLAPSQDPGFKSDKVVLIPAMEWGTDAQGVALIYGPRTVPDPPSTVAAAQAQSIRVQAQGGVFAIAHPCFPTQPWKWGLSYVNAIEVWCRGWRDVPPFALEQLPEEAKLREGGKLVYSIAAAAALNDAETFGSADGTGFNAAKVGVPFQSVSANMQSAKFWDYETVRGLMAGAIGGSNSSSPKVPLAAPVTYIYAANKSLPALLEGLRLGRTFVARDLNGPQIKFTADVLNDGKVDAGLGDIMPLNVEAMMEVVVSNAAGKKLQILLNGRPIVSKVIEGEGFVYRFPQTPTSYSVYRVQVIGSPEKPSDGFGPIEMHAMSSPIYAQEITQELLLKYPGINLDKTWVRVAPDKGQEITDLPEADAPLQFTE